MKRLPELKGKSLGCWCKPEACHGDVLVRLLAEYNPDETYEKAFPLHNDPAIIEQSYVHIPKPKTGGPCDYQFEIKKINGANYRVPVLSGSAGKFIEPKGKSMAE